MMRIDQIRENILAKLAPQHLEVIDESEKHRGHAGFQEGGESHFHVIIRSDQLVSLSRLKRHRAVYDAIGAELMGKIHALSMDILT